MHRETKKQKKRQNHQSGKPEIITESEIQKNPKKGVIEGK